MSNFSSLDQVTAGLAGTAQRIFVASTPDLLATILAPGYLNDRDPYFQANDIVYINYADNSTFPLNVGMSAIAGEFMVTFDPTALNWSLIQTSAQSSGVAALGVHSALYSNAGGSATTTITDSSITPSSKVLARWKSSANSVSILTVAPGNGTLTVVSSGDPGVSVLEYIAILPSVALETAGVIAANASVTGATTTIVITNANITTSMIVNANFVSQTNAAFIRTIAVTAGTITITTNTAPGVSVISYQAVLPSSALTAAGLYGASYSNAGGSTTITISDSTITANSIVTADFASQANAANIYKVTATSGTLTVLANADPGVSVVKYNATPNAIDFGSGTFLLASENLADVQNPALALANLGGLALAGGIMTGKITMAKGTGTEAANAVTINAQSGVITTSSLTTAAAAAYAITFTNSAIATTSVVLMSLMGGTNTTQGIQLRAAAGNGTSSVSIYNNNVAGSALNGTLIIGFLVV